YPLKGVIDVGSDADLVLWDPEKQVSLTNAMMHHGSDYTPYEGKKVTGYPIRTYLRGRLIFKNDEVVGEGGTGKFLPRQPYEMIKPSGKLPTPFDPVLGKMVS